MKERYSENYVMTAYTKSAGDMLELERIRKAVRVINKELRYHTSYNSSLGSTQFRVKCQGRGPRTRAALRDGRHPRSYDQSLPLRHAVALDVYIYQT
tara:strand:+ start:50 stop:340 length:291 start_codon:yes stop_codon:yes gene_type:complete